MQVAQKVFVANVTTQVVERHIFRGIEKTFSPMVVSGLSDSDAEVMASEPASGRRQREFLGDRITKLENGRAILQSIMGFTAL